MQSPHYSNAETSIVSRLQQAYLPIMKQTCCKNMQLMNKDYGNGRF
jgi:hypothetical protein